MVEQKCIKILLMVIIDMEAGMPESFNVLVKEIRSLGIDIELEQRLILTCFMHEQFSL